MPVPEVFAHKGRDLAKPNSAARNGTRRYEYAVVTMVIATLLQMMASPLLLERLPYLFLLLGVAYTARRYGFGPALLSVGLGTLIADYFFIAPMFSFAIVTPQTALQIGSYIFLGFALALIMTAFRRSYPVRFTS
jgi:K+-sensing histidine kinase KdpD